MNKFVFGVFILFYFSNNNFAQHHFEFAWLPMGESSKFNLKQKNKSNDFSEECQVNSYTYPEFNFGWSLFVTDEEMWYLFAQPQVHYKYSKSVLYRNNNVSLEPNIFKPPTITSYQNNTPIFDYYQIGNDTRITSNSLHLGIDLGSYIYGGGSFALGHCYLNSKFLNSDQTVRDQGFFMRWSYKFGLAIPTSFFTLKLFSETSFDNYYFNSTKFKSESTDKVLRNFSKINAKSVVNNIGFSLSFYIASHE